MEGVDIRDALNNVGLPQLAIKVNNTIYELDKSDIRTIVEKIEEFDDYYIKGWEGSKSRSTLVNAIWDYVETFRCYSVL